jgi:oxygen-independent coproporphyrinogen-3 oxidase
MSTGQDGLPLALYIHIPFCESMCPYCDFNTYAGIEQLIPSYVQALCREIELWGSILGRPAVRTVFLGGGTPSYIPTDGIDEVLSAAREAFDLESDAEVTLEANPDDCTEAKLEVYSSLGVNRVSLGVQSLDDRLLGVLGRRHTAAQAVEAYRTVTEAGIDNVSVDLMYGIPDQTLADWRRTLEGAAELGPRHVSLYCLTLEGDTPMERSVASGAIAQPDPDLAADMYLLAEETMAARQYRHYEISNWAVPGYESRHNLVYWRNEPNLGVGPGAHSYLGGVRFWNLRSPGEYVRRVRKLAPPSEVDGWSMAEIVGRMPMVERSETIDRRMEMSETLMMGLRLDTGVGVNEFVTRFGEPPTAGYGDAIEELSSVGLLDDAGGRLRLTDRGRMFGDEVFSRFFS